MTIQYFTSRSGHPSPCEALLRSFGNLCQGPCDAQYLDATQTRVFGIAGLAHVAPVSAKVLRDLAMQELLDACPTEDILLQCDAGNAKVRAWGVRFGTAPRALPLPQALADAVAALCLECAGWAGTLDGEGRHILDPRNPMPGPHFGVNLLMGDRIGFEHPLQTTPKSVVDMLGRGSFRSHAATQVLATRWDVRQEENGFPANRQFYLTEKGRRIFYSGWVGDDPVQAQCVHSPNATTITMTTQCGLRIAREIFLAAQEPGLPLACEIQQITLTNQGTMRRDLRLVATGMFGPSKPIALMEDVLYSTIIMQAGLLRNNDGSVLALVPDYHPIQDRDDVRFHAMVVHRNGERAFPTEFGTDYREFLGQGTLEFPEGVGRLSNRLSRKGPGFFAMAAPVPLEPGQSVTVLNFTGLVCARETPESQPRRDVLVEQLQALLQRYDGADAVAAARKAREEAFRRHAGFLRLETRQGAFDAWANQNLPFQVFYQTFVSRSFDQTQKGYREIGFREVQDLFASMAPLCAEGRADFVEDLLGEWAAQVYAFGYANHNFYWEGKEPGLWSDDALWFVSAVARFVRLTGRAAFLQRPFPTADRDGTTRPILQTLRAIVHYSGKVSIGRHGLPLLDRADWNDCLKVDKTHPDGAAKQRAWEAGTPLQTDGTESVMNAFLLKLAADDLAWLSGYIADKETRTFAIYLARDIAHACRVHAWKDTWFARLLVNRPTAHPVVGAPGDGLATDGFDGCLFLNSFSWAILSGVADEEQIRAMFPLLESRLKTPHGYRLVTAHDLRRVEPTVASAEYFPGDRENGAVFKHASLMAVLALFQGASQVEDRELAAAMAHAAWAMVDLAAPFRTMQDPYALAGNPRFCTQYNNSETGENIGPLLSGTASWSTLALRRAFGIEWTANGMWLDPLLRERDTEVRVTLQWESERYEIVYRKPIGFVRSKDTPPTIVVDGQELAKDRIPRVAPGQTCAIEVRWNS
ncbi:GH36-type glycosyl hydrolase domain-containing protein [Candidatus Symbiobacter mobilis]|uniref:GH36-type glycosyl hydrolase domain-containing protein n=1 Tax=Candidatus Symbiobacter mobilis TaxID=1436290 RepID=UPI001651899D|nr:glycosyl transferase [Candidatus Symbiobacter mobilis]